MSCGAVSVRQRFGSADRSEEETSALVSYYRIKVYMADADIAPVSALILLPQFDTSGKISFITAQGQQKTEVRNG